MFCAASIAVLFVAAVGTALKRRPFRLAASADWLAEQQRNVLLSAFRRKHGYVMCIV